MQSQDFCSLIRHADLFETRGSDAKTGIYVYVSHEATVITANLVLWSVMLEGLMVVFKTCVFRVGFGES